MGSQLERKSETNIRIEKDASGVSVIWADKNRRAPISKKTAPRFVWSEEHQMHVIAQSSKKTQGDIEREALTKLARDIFTKHPAMRFTELQTTVKKHLAVSEKTAERKISSVPSYLES